MIKSHRNASRGVDVTEESPVELIKLLFSDLAKILILADIEPHELSGFFEEELRLAADSKTGTARVEVLGLAQRDCMELLCAWRRHEAYLDSVAEPIALDFDGRSPSFRSLCQEIGTKCTPEELRDRLISFNAIQVESDGRLKPLTPTFLATDKGAVPAVAVDTAIRQLVGFTNTVYCNVATGSPKRFERSCTVTVPAELAPIFERLVKERGQILVDSLDEWLERRRNEASHGGAYAELGVGVYTINKV